MLENRTNAPENECFCFDEEDEGTCPNTGALFVGACYGGDQRTTYILGNLSCKKDIFVYLGAPLIGSNPHFFNGDPRYITGVEGLSPNQTKHETFFILEEVSFVLF